MLQDKLTILVCSCDKYADLWEPLFTLLKRYWEPMDLHILLNTETLNFSFEGLDIECIHSPAENRYGQRMINALSRVKTKYVLLLLDDFFLRSPVNINRIEEILHWMEEDSDIVYFNCDPNEVYADWEVDKYPGFKRIPPGNPYTFTLQAAIWRTDMFIKSWLPSVNPWEWELLTTARAYKWTRKKFYCLHDINASFLDYGHYRFGDIWGVYRGKWCIDDVKPVFDREGIQVDFSIRGVNATETTLSATVSDDWGTFKQISRCLGNREVPKYYLYYRYCQLLYYLKKPVTWDYFKFLQQRAQKRFLKQRYL